MRLGEIDDVDVVADGGAVGGGIVSAVDVDGTVLGGGLEDERDQVGLGIVALAVALGGTGGVEVAQRGAGEASGGGGPAEHALEEELGLAVGVGGLRGGVFGDRQVFGIAVDGGGGAEDEALDSGGDHGVEDGEQYDESRQA